MGEVVAKVNRQTEVTAVLFPPCLCSAPINQHLSQHESCTGYAASRPVEILGTVAFKSPSLLANIFWRLESFFQKLRIRYSRR